MQLKAEILKLLEQLGILYKFPHVFTVFVLCEKLWKATLLGFSQGGSCYARGYSVVNLEQSTVCYIVRVIWFKCVTMTNVLWLLMYYGYYYMGYYGVLVFIQCGPMRTETYSGRKAKIKNSVWILINCITMFVVMIETLPCHLTNYEHMDLNNQMTFLLL
jgi:hypothetical protein